MLDNARYVRSYMQDKSHSDLVNCIDIRFVVERGLQNVGEATFQLRRVDPKILAQIRENDRIIAMRHILVHGYDEVKPDVLWNVINKKLDLLIQDVVHLLESIDQNAP